MNADFQIILQKVEVIQQRFGLSSVTPQLRACRELLSHSDVIQVAVFGRYKSGKSSFLNALADTKVLPVGVLPVTTILTRMRYGPTESARAEFLDRREISIELGEIEEYVAEERNPRNEKQVAAVHIELPSLERYKGFEFVDTPGIGSLFKHSTEVSLRWLPYAAVALVLVSVDQPLSEEDLGFISQLRRHTPRVILILAKADRVGDAELAKIRAFSTTHLTRELRTEIPVFPFCSLPDVDEGRPAKWRAAVDEQVLRPICANSAHEHEQILAHKCGSLIDECTSLLNIALTAATRSAEERLRIKEYVFEEGQSLPLIQKEIRLLTHDLTSTMMDRLWQHLGVFHGEVEAKLVEDFHRQWPQWRANLWDLTRIYEQWLRAGLTRELKELSESERLTLLAPLKEAEAALTHVVERFLAQLAKRVTEILGVATARAEHRLHITEPDFPDVDVGAVFDTPWDTLWFLIPMILFRSLVRRHFIKQINWEVEKHLPRLAAQWSERINRAIEKAAKEEESYVQGQISTFQTMLSETDRQIPAIRQVLDELQSLRILTAQKPGE